MGMHNQQRRAAKAKARRRRRAPAGHQGAGSAAHAAWPWTGAPPADPDRTEDDRIADDIADAVGSLAAGTPQTAAAPLQRLLDRGAPAALRVATCHQLSAMLEARIDDAWTRGWRPVDLHNLTGRNLNESAKLVVADAMAAQLAAFATATIAPAWAEQLRTMGASRWWRASDDFVTARSGTDGFERTVRSAVDVAALLAMLPTIERLDPLPGTARPQRSEPSDQVDPRILERVRRLLAQAESTPYEAEADTFTAAAQSLMARHSLDVAMLSVSADGPADPAGPVRLWVERPYEQEKIQLLHVVAEANRCRAVWTSDFGFATVIGHRPDLAAVEAIFTSLLLQATRAMVGEGRQVTSSGRSRTRSFRRSFLFSYATRIGERLQAATDSETASVLEEHDANPSGDTDASRALVRVLAKRSAEVDAVVDELFPQLVSKASSFTPDLYGWSAGQRAADAATLSGAKSTLAKPSS